MLPLLIKYSILALAITHLGYIFVDSYLMSFYRHWMASKGPYTKELSTCIICTTTQLSLALCWLVGPLFPSPNLFAYAIGYLVSSMFLAKLSLTFGSLLELIIYVIGAISSYLSSNASYGGPGPSESMDQPLDEELI
jgi:hypothetical protein